MKRKLFEIILFGALVLGLAGCGVKYPEIKDDAIAFDMGEYTDESDDNAGYGTIVYNGRTYMPYGTIKNSIKSKDIKECIGYIIQNETSSSIADSDDNNTRVYTLVEDSNENYLMIYYVGTTLMNHPDFWRAVDTKSSEIDTPKYIESLDYSYWK